MVKNTVLLHMIFHLSVDELEPYRHVQKAKLETVNSIGVGHIAQETTGEFAFRLNQAVEGHPLAPPTPHGRQRWLLRELERSQNISVSPNTMSKWFSGNARPREDRVRAIARALKVDEVWLALGRTPIKEPEGSVAGVIQDANDAVLNAMVMIRNQGGQATVGEGGHTLNVNMGGESFTITPVMPQTRTDEDVSFVVPEPAQGRVIGIELAPSNISRTTECKLMIDLTDLDRQNFGGFSAVKLERRKGGKYKAEGRENLLSPLPSARDLTGQ
jgi:transcriptional regulator with XRE-family HTH domain